MVYKLIFNTALPFSNQIQSSLPHPSSVTVMDGGLHPFIAFTYFSAHPLNDTHSYTPTPHLSFIRSLKILSLNTLCFSTHSHYYSDSWVFIYASLLHLETSSSIFFFFYISGFHTVSLSVFLDPPSVVCFHTPLLSIHSAILKRTEYDRGMTEEWYYQKDKWAYSTYDCRTKSQRGRSFVPCLDRECVYVSTSL